MSIMASIHKDPRGKSPYWYCAYTLPNGKRVFRSTKCTDKKEAKAFCEKLAQASNIAKKGRLTEDRARELISEISEVSTGKPLASYTAKAWFEHWLKLKKARSPKTLARYEQVVRDFLVSLGERAHIWLHQITSDDVLAYRDSITAAGKSARTANLSVTVISAAFNAALRVHKTDINPCVVLDKLPEENSIERDTFTPAQVAKLFEAAKGDWKGAILLAYFTGARLSDVANMQWSALDWKNKTLSFTQHKTKKPLTVPLHPQLEKELRKNPGIGKTPMFPSLAGKETGGNYGLTKQFKAVRQKAGIEGRQVKAHGQRILSSLSFHSLRHSFTSALANRGVSPEVRMKLTGHSDKDVHQGYTHHELETLRAAVAHIPSIK
jgi:integrase